MKQILVVIDEELHRILKSSYTFNLRIKSNLDFPNIQKMFIIKYIRFVDLTWGEILKSDIFIFNKSQFFLSAISILINLIKKLNKIIIFDLDDYCLELPSYSFSQHLNYGARLTCFEKNLKRSDVVIVSTPFLKNQLIKYNKNIEIVENTLDVKSLKSYHFSKNTIRILITSNDNLKINKFKNDFINCLIEIKNKYKERVEIIFLGKFTNINNLTEISDYIYDRILPQEYNIFLYNNDFQIGLVPLGGNEDPDTLISHSCKSNIKFLEFANYGIAGIYSNVEPYKRIINNTEGVIVNNSYKEWYDAIEKLIGDQILCNRIVKGSQKKYKAEFSKIKSREKWFIILKSLKFENNKNVTFSISLSGTCMLKYAKFIYHINKLWQKLLFIIMLIKKREFSEIKLRIKNIIKKLFKR